MKNNINPSEKNFFPLMIDFTDRKVVIFGGGSVGTRKARLLSRYAETTVISNSFSSKLIKFVENLNSNVKLTLKHLDINCLSDEDLINLISDAFLVIPATSDLDLNNRVIKIANKSKILINPVTNIGDIIVPSVVHKKGIMIGISTNGQSPALTKYIRKKLEGVISKEYEQMLQLTKEIRTYLKKNVKSREMRKEILWAVLESESVWKAFNTSYELAHRTAYEIVATFRKGELI